MNTEGAGGQAEVPEAPPVAAARDGGDNAMARWANGAFFCLSRSPALLAALLVARAIELTVMSRVTNLPGDIMHVALYAVGIDLIVLCRFLLVLILILLPPVAALCRRPGAPLALLATVGSIFLTAQSALDLFFATAHVPLGADLFGYSLHEIRITVAGSGLSFDFTSFVVFFLPLAIFWSGLCLMHDRKFERRAHKLVMVALLTFMILSLPIPLRPSLTDLDSDLSFNLALNKSAYFISESFDYFARADPGNGAVSDAGTPGFDYVSPEYPFLRREETPDVLGDYFRNTPGDTPPNLVFIVVEGLGRSFTGPDASLGSFTPFLDELGSKSLYWVNCLAPQGRTFGLLPSLFGSLPFARQGFNALDQNMPEHQTLLSILKRQGYRLSFYIGVDLDFDNQRAFLERQGVDRMIGIWDFEANYARSPGGPDRSWGYPDGALFDKALATHRADMRAPFVMTVQTISMHTPYLVPGQGRFVPIFEQRMRDLELDSVRRNEYRTYRDIYTTILYVDDALRRFFDEFEKLPEYEHTIFVITGDHRLPEIPLSSKIDRYHVPLIIFSPMLKRPALIRSISSHFDVTPSLLAFLSRNYGLKTPRLVTWLGSGLDMEPAFRNVHEIPLKQTTGNLINFISGTWFLDQETLFSVSPSLSLEPVKDEGRQAEIEARFERFRIANAQLARTLKLLPPESMNDSVSYDDLPRVGATVDKVMTEPAMIEVAEIAYPKSVRLRAPFELTLRAFNPASCQETRVVPIVVILDTAARQLSETDGSSLTLAPGDSSVVTMEVSTRNLPRGLYYLAVILTDPTTGIKVGRGQYRNELTIR